MKKLFMLSTLILCLAVLFLTPAAATLIADVDTTNGLTKLNPLYWTGNDVNPSNQLKNSNPTTEEAWLEAILGLVYNDINVTYYSKTDYPSTPEIKSLVNFNPGFNFEYAVVKYGQYWAAYEADGSNGLSMLNIDPLNRAISHVTYFNGTPVAPVPEPATMLLLGSGLIGLAGFGRRKLFKKG